MEAKAQVIDKSYVALISSVCKKMEGGGCVINTYCLLTFKQETVELMYYTKATCTPIEREADYDKTANQDIHSYHWSEKNGSIKIAGFEDYGVFTQKDKMLIAKNKGSVIEFIEK